MPTRVRFRFNKVTGEVEEFLVDDQDRRLPEAEHDRIASEVAALVAVDPRILEVVPGAEADRGSDTLLDDGERSKEQGDRTPLPERE